MSLEDIVKPERKEVHTKNNAASYKDLGGSSKASHRPNQVQLEHQDIKYNNKLLKKQSISLF